MIEGERKLKRQRADGVKEERGHGLEGGVKKTSEAGLSCLSDFVRSKTANG